MSPLMRIIKLLALLVCVCATSGCSILVVTIDTMRNEPLAVSKQVKPTPAKETISLNDLPDGIFVGIGLSGGGSRAANFSAAVLLELEKLGILNKATAISSVSGSSVTAAYYGLYRSDKKRWNEQAVRKQIGKDFEFPWLARWLLPQNILLYWYTNFNRSDIMKETLDAELFHGRTFGDMGTTPPRILINATRLIDGERFIFSEEQFRKLGSRLDTFPLANAVMASSAYPGAFHDMTLKDYSAPDEERYEHLIDAGPSDNLGITTLLTMAAELYRAPEKPKGCFLIIVDAYPASVSTELRRLPDTRQLFDFFYARNVSAASDALLSARRIDLLHELNEHPGENGIDPFQPNIGPDAIYPDPDDILQIECAAWHLNLQRLYSKEFGGKTVRDDKKLRGEITELAEIVNSIPTRYKLTGDGPSADADLDSKALQDRLFKAANYLIHLDKGENEQSLLQQVCDWFNQKGVQDLKCSPSAKEKKES